MDVELLSASAGGDASALLGQFGALLIFGSLLLSFGALGVGYAATEPGISREVVAAVVWSGENFMVSVTMLVVGVFALLSWDSTFLDRRDVLVLAPLPIHERTLCAAKIAAAASAVGLTVAACNLLAGFAWPIELAPSGAGVAGTIRLVAAFWITLLAAGTFLYCAVLGVQAVAAQLPRRWYLRVSSVLQIVALVLFLGVFFFQPSLANAKALGAPENQRALAWLPSYWFMGLLSELSGAYAAEGHVVMAPLALRAVVSLGIAIFVAAGAFLLAYLRTMRKIVEEPDSMPGSHGGIWLPRFGSSPQTALAQFVIRTLLRSRRHRAVLALYLGGGCALVAVYLQGAREAMHLTGTEIIRTVNVPMLVASVLMLCALWLGVRTAFSLPLDLRANWLFRVVPSQGGGLCLSAIRRALMALSVVPVLVSCTALLLWFWPWTSIAEHLLILGLLGSLLADCSLKGFRKIPFTCSYLPGKSKVHLVFWFAIIPVVIIIHKFVELEYRAMATPLSYCAMAFVLGAAAFAARRFATASAIQNGPEIQFEESASDELLVLGLSR